MTFRHARFEWGDEAKFVWHEGIDKFNPHHDDKGRFAEGDGVGDDKRWKSSSNYDDVNREIERTAYGRKGVSVEDRQLLGKYFGGTHGMMINKALRGKSDDPELLDEGRQWTEAFDRNALPTKQDLVTYRGIHGTAADELKVGDSFTDNGIVSTTGSQNWAAQFATGSVFGTYSDPHGTVVEVHIPKGTKIMGDRPRQGIVNEHEIALRPGTRFKVVGRRERGPGGSLAGMTVEVVK